jgi:hypothetical protein
MAQEKPTLIEKHECPGCGRLHDSYDRAGDCCHPALVNVCSHCNGQFDPEGDEWPDHLQALADEERESEKEYRYLDLIREGTPPIDAQLQVKEEFRD